MNQREVWVIIDKFFFSILNRILNPGRSLITWTRFNPVEFHLVTNANLLELIYSSFLAYTFTFFISMNWLCKKFSSLWNIYMPKVYESSYRPLFQLIFVLIALFLITLNYFVVSLKNLWKNLFFFLLL